MNVLLISQCSKRALTETRRILDQFAERRGDRTWQTPITWDGLTTLRKLLKKTARKNTAVACHWIRGKDHSELMWIVGNASEFNTEGAVPTNTTQRNVLRSEDENDWHRLEIIKLLAQLAGLLHDLGKASVAFQERLHGKRMERNLYRHEWVSLRLFQAFVGDDDDAGWLSRLADFEQVDEQQWLAMSRYQRDGLDADDGYPFQSLPPLAAALGWLVLTHHRLPVVPVIENGQQQWLGRRSKSFEWSWLEQPLHQIAHNWNEIYQPASAEQIEPYWQMAGALPVIESKWRAQASRFARRLHEVHEKSGSDWLNNPYVMHLARLSLMLADHHYSSLSSGSPERISGDGQTGLYANTSADGSLKQPLDEHLLGVSHAAGSIARALPGFERHLPRLARHRALRKRTTDQRFSWQNKAFDAAVSMREEAASKGAFIVNMASTGCGKTLANARILYALSNPQKGMRATYALGLRTLTMQTGRSYRQDLHLDDDELAVLVGGSASRALFEFYQARADGLGSASIQSLMEEDSHVLYEGNTADHPLLSRALANPEIRKLVSAPLLVCTVDHMVPATESLRAGRQIAPMLRLMSSDLILDELDDYDLNDLPALTRLVYWAGLLGSRVILSSATLPPALVEGMFLSYQAGRGHYQRNRGEHTL
ncbi:MAG: type I-F CRISPR-associated helicase Cas3, partial [Marinospirillum sp.]|uniref:type I-F CRISPR-associated helicase Cas3f n=1 Tax=Marinospirillum sp. TaxID=2183934 RepID=UPI0019DF2600